MTNNFIIACTTKKYNKMRTLFVHRQQQTFNSHILHVLKERFLMKRSISAISGAHFSSYISPAVENNLSDATEVGGGAR